MTGARRVHDRAILDALEAIEPEPFRGEVWRVARKGREPLRGSTAYGRWSPAGEIEVLYTSLERHGALAEVGFRLSLEPVWPSRLEHEIHRIRVAAERLLQIAEINALEPLGVDAAKYTTFDYTATQAIAAAAHFLQFDGLRVPSARASCSTVVLFVDRVAGTGILELIESQDVDWREWLKRGS